jgi:hypothetical protein
MHPTEEQLQDPRSRHLILRGIQPRREAAKQNRERLLRVLAEETKHRQRESEWDDADWKFYENLYWCAFLLYLAGNPQDARVIWEAKYISMDTGGGLDCQCLVGAGVECTLRFLEDSGEHEIVADIRNFQSCGDFDDLESWEKGRIRYFYGEE